MGRVMNSLRRLGSLPGVRKVALHPPVRRIIARALMVRFVVAAWDTTQPWRLVSGEVFRRRATEQYTLRTTGLPVVFQHGRDLEILYEVHHRHEYAPPAGLARRLDRDGLRILDIGANVGLFSSWAFGRWPTCRLIAFEPEPSNAAQYRRWAATAEATVTLHQAAAAPAAGEFRFAAHGSGSSITADGPMTVDAVDIFEFLPDADFVKMDIEGGEWAILADERLHLLDDVVFVIEYHRHLAPSQPCREAAEQAFRRAGFTTGHGTHNYWGHGTLWAWK